MREMLKSKNNNKKTSDTGIYPLKKSLTLFLRKHVDNLHSSKNVIIIL